VQRIPVRIELEQPPPRDRPLRVGASLDVTINVADRSGAYLLQPAPVRALSSTSRQP
jgi:membrane fusion protein (multidrug efflux system)